MPGKPSSAPIEALSEIEQPHFLTESGVNASLAAAPAFPGGYLRGIFKFRSRARLDDGRYELPDISLAWIISSGDLRASGCINHHTPARPSLIRVDKFDFENGEGTATFQLSMVAANRIGPPLFSGENRIDLFIVPGTVPLPTRIVDPQRWFHRFAALTVVGTQPSFAVTVLDVRLHLGQQTTGVLVLDRATEQMRTFRLHAVFSGLEQLACGESPRNGFHYPHKVRVPGGERNSSFPIRFLPSPCGNSEGTVRLRATDPDGACVMSNPISLATLIEASPIFAGDIFGQSNPMPFPSSEYLHCRPAAIFNGDMYTRQESGPHDTPPALPKSYLTCLYKPYACLETSNKESCLKYAVTKQVPLYRATPRLVSSTSCNIPSFQAAPATYYIDIDYTPTGMAKALTIEDCQSI